MDMEEVRVADLLVSLPRALRLLRKSRKLGQDDLERLTEKRGEKVGLAHIARYESGARAPSLSNLRNLLGALDVSWKEFGEALASAHRADGKTFTDSSSDGGSELPRKDQDKDEETDGSVPPEGEEDT